jgi:alginate O-acetyltransferase complex protein AlgI
MARGIGFFVVGLIKKAVVADSIAMYLDPALASYSTLSTAGAWLAALGYTFQIYYDFSGYSDMAVGLGYLFGLHIPQNFNAPYRALGPRDFWRRWHISLSTWLRDYLYIPLGGNRFGEARTMINLLVTMLLGGLWHGANWTFVVWGAYHGMLLIVERVLDPWLTRVPTAMRRAGTFVLVVFSWVLFRSDSMDMAGQWMARMLGIGGGTQSVPPSLIVLVALSLVAVNTLPETWDIRFGIRYRWAPAYALGFLLAYLFVNGRHSVFLYYQF